ncbi:branched-chain alpha-keto acid dehydrogenase subunit E2 [Rhizobium sp. Root149]|jgi:2-oxoisovalerate dehydrogenase E2 component (dihydrolipoyl transacylase)|uniref:dihydrolipoamide acetyltransferase family protein n=1 Tax=Rhizobium TaxID=379 RepID=UPI00071468E0|nr:MULTISPECIES: dihydrolipoamide acetyltransferase family protein [Rhizobium]KQZ48545.1 branched-chain alpha-keto acid dehydrogenase subunit E2 [Rhizobium sp. Root149]
MGIRTIRLPDVGEGVTEAEVTEILVKPGDLVREDDPIAAVMTDKATVEITSAYSGKVIWIGGEVGKTLAIGSDLIRIEDESAGGDDDGAPSLAPAEAQPAPASTSSTAAQTESCPLKASPSLKVVETRPSALTSTATPPRAEGVAVLASPAVRARAKEAGIDLRQVAGSGPAGRITHADLDHLFQNAGQAQPRNPPRPETVETVKVVGLRRMIAKRMSEANATIPHITVVEEVDVTEIEALRVKLNETRGDKPKLTILPLIAAALVKAKESCPKIFARYDDEAEEVHYSTAVHIGIATMTEAGLMVPVVRNAQALSPYQLAGEIARLSDACREGKAKREELSGSTITITSLGPLGAIATTPIINKPEVAILGVNRMAVRPSWNGSAFVPRTMMNISASFDHRIIDGWDAAVFVQRMKTLLETPALIFMKD